MNWMSKVRLYTSMHKKAILYTTSLLFPASLNCFIWARFARWYWWANVHFCGFTSIKCRLPIWTFLKFMIWRDDFYLLKIVPLHMPGKRLDGHIARLWMSQLLMRCFSFVPAYFKSNGLQCSLLFYSHQWCLSQVSRSLVLAQKVNNQPFDVPQAAYLSLHLWQPLLLKGQLLCDVHTV